MDCEVCEKEKVDRTVEVEKESGKSIMLRFGPKCAFKLFAPSGAQLG